MKSWVKFYIYIYIYIYIYTVMWFVCCVGIHAQFFMFCSVQFCKWRLVWTWLLFSSFLTHLLIFKMKAGYITGRNLSRFLWRDVFRGWVPTRRERAGSLCLTDISNQKALGQKWDYICDTYCIATFVILDSAIGLLVEERYVSCICDTVKL